jgi:hypothetical protein
MIENLPMMPFGCDPQTQARWEHTALRRRLIIGAWEQDIEDELSRHLPPDRRESWGPADLSSNPFEQITRQLAVLYHETPNINNLNGDISALVNRDGLVMQAGLWPLMQRVQQMVIGLRESIVRIDITMDANDVPNGVQYRLVTPDFVYCESDPDRPDVPNYYRELRLRKNEHGKMVWVADVLDIRNPNAPMFGMFIANTDGTLGEDVTQYYTGQPTQVGEAYPYRDSQGRPYLPLVMYHAEKTGHLWDAYNGSQMVYGSLTSAVLYSMWVHCVRDCAWAQKYGVGIGVAGLSQMDTDQISRRSSIATDPSSILMFTQDPDATGQPMIGTFTNPTDPHSLLESVAKYEMRVALSAGLSPSDISRQQGDPRSGFALAVSKSGQRDAQKKYAPVFRMADEELLSKTAMLANRFMGTKLPEDGYRVSYQSMPLTPDEMRAQREDIISKLQAGLISPVTAVMMMYEDMDPREARDYLEQIRRDRAQYQL